MPQFAPDGNPTIDGCRPAVLRVLADGRQRALSEVVDLVAAHLELDEDVVAQRISSGQRRLQNRVAWACSSFARSKLLDRPSRGQYRITNDGRVVDARGLLEYSEQDMLEWPAWSKYVAEVEERKRAKQLDEGSGHDASDPSTDDPVSSVQADVESWNDSVETELRTALQEASPEFFEKAVLEVLWAMGYGGGQGAREHLGRSGDGGIDGVIRQDPLGLQNVYVQAKRYADSNTVGSPDINGFFGALARRGADRGVFITTSKFSQDAETAASQFGGKIVLVDGIRLTALMLQYGIGVQPARQFTMFTVDHDFFSTEE